MYTPTYIKRNRSLIKKGIRKKLFARTATTVTTATTATVPTTATATTAAAVVMFHVVVLTVALLLLCACTVKICMHTHSRKLRREDSIFYNTERQNVNSKMILLPLLRS